MSRPISVIAYDIRAAWPKVSPYAKPYLDAMTCLDRITDKYYYDDAKSVVLYFLSNAASFRGPEARALKAELNAILASAKVVTEGEGW
jgi:hypothetical protein